MRFIAILILAVGVAGAAPSATAAPPGRTGYSHAYELCVASYAAQTSDRAMGACIGDEMMRHDVRLNRAYQAALGRLEFPRQKAALRKAQRAWIAFRDADCDSYGDADWGPSSRVDGMACRLERTAERADELEAYRLSN
jgi:uncharacterized protein YecT (DUF1311 family)